MSNNPEWVSPTYCQTNYSLLLRGLIETGKTTIPFDAQSGKGILLRHDIDFNLTMAATIAQLNKQAGISATFFILAASPVYNLFTPDSQQALKTISDCGQTIGLHYHHQSDFLDVERLNKEFNVLKAAAPDARKVVAWHNPVKDLAPINKTAAKANFISAYSDELFGHDRYISDSNFRNSPQEIFTAITQNTHSRLQVLLHPLNWFIGGDTMESVLKKAFSTALSGLLAHFEENACWKNEFANSTLCEFSTPEKLKD